MRKQCGSAAIRRRFPTVLVSGFLGALLVLLCACASPSAQPSTTSQPGPAAKPAAPAKFQIAVGITPDTLDPAGQTTVTVANMVDYVVETLVRIDSAGTLRPGLAEFWDTSPDGLTVTFHLRQGVKFQDGTPFDADAVKFNLDRILNPEVRVPQRINYRGIQSVEVVDDATVQLHLKEPAPGLVGALSHTNAAMVSPASIDKFANTLKTYQHPVGTGPYQFKEYVKGSQLTVERFPAYWGQKPYYDTVVFRFVPEAATRESLVLSGQVDMMILPPTSDIPALQKNGRVQVLVGASSRAIFVALNTQDPRLQDKRVRQALNYAVDKEAIVQKVLFGTAEVLDAPMSRSLFGYCAQPAYTYDPDKARQLLAEAGVHDLDLKFISPTGRYIQDFQAAQAVSGYMAKVGVKATLSTMDWPTYQATIATPADKATVQMHLFGWVPAFLDAGPHMAEFQSDNQPPAGMATSYYSNPQVDKLLSQAAKTMDEATRKQLYCSAATIVWDDAPWIFLWTQSFPVVYSNKVTGIETLPNEKFSALYAHPAQ